MAISFIAKGGERLDFVVKQEFKSLLKFEEILQNNPHIQHKIFLDFGDVILFKIDTQKDFILIKEESQELSSSLEETLSLGGVEIVFKEPLDTTDEEENLKALW